MTKKKPTPAPAAPDFANLKRRTSDPDTTTPPPAAVQPPVPSSNPPADPLVQFTTRTDAELRKALKARAVDLGVDMQDMMCGMLERGMDTPLNVVDAAPTPVVDTQAEAYMALIRSNTTTTDVTPSQLKAEAELTNVVILSFKMRKSMKKRLLTQAGDHSLTVQEYVNVLLSRALRTR